MYRVTVAPTDMFQALSDHTRLRIMRLLCAFPEEEVCLCELSESLAEPEYNISRHLKILRRTSLLDSFKEGRWVYHKLINDSRLHQELYKFIAEFPDSDNSLREDRKRLKKQISLREKPRCVREPRNEIAPVEK